MKGDDDPDDWPDTDLPSHAHWNVSSGNLPGGTLIGGIADTELTEEQQAAEWKFRKKKRRAHRSRGFGVGF